MRKEVQIEEEEVFRRKTLARSCSISFRILMNIISFFSKNNQEYCVLGFENSRSAHKRVGSISYSRRGQLTQILKNQQYLFYFNLDACISLVFKATLNKDGNPPLVMQQNIFV